MAQEEITPEQVAAEEETEKRCLQGKIDSASQKLNQQTDEAQTAAAEALQEASKSLKELIKTINDISAGLHQAITGMPPKFKPPASPAEASVTIESIKAIVDPVVAAITALPIPSIPGIGALGGVFTALGELASKAGPPPARALSLDGNLPDLSPALVTNLKTLFNDMWVLVNNMFFCLVSLLYDIVNSLIGVVSGIPGCPAMPFPITIIGNAISLIPNVLKLSWQIPTALYDKIENMLRCFGAQINALQFPDNLPTPPQMNPFSPCAKHTEPPAEETMQPAE